MGTLWNVIFCRLWVESHFLWMRWKCMCVILIKGQISTFIVRNPRNKKQCFDELISCPSNNIMKHLIQLKLIHSNSFSAIQKYYSKLVCNQIQTLFVLYSLCTNIYDTLIDSIVLNGCSTKFLWIVFTTTYRKNAN